MAVMSLRLLIRSSTVKTTRRTTNRRWRTRKMCTPSPQERNKQLSLHKVVERILSSWLQVKPFIYDWGLEEFKKVVKKKRVSYSMIATTSPGSISRVVTVMRFRKLMVRA